jgi:hypothetical protein
MSGPDVWCTVVGVVADALGHCQWNTATASTVVDRDGREHLSVQRSTTSSIDPAWDYAWDQPSSIPILWKHRAPGIGNVVLLDRRQNRLAAVGVLPLPAEVFDGVKLYWSARSNADPPFTISELTLTPSPASVALPPVQFFPGLPANAKLYNNGPRVLLANAEEALRSTGGTRYLRCSFDDAEQAPRTTAATLWSSLERRFAERGERLESGPSGSVVVVNGHRPRGLS